MSLRGPVPKSNKDSHFMLNNVALAGMTDSEVKIKQHQVKEDKLKNNNNNNNNKTRTEVIYQNNLSSDS